MKDRKTDYDDLPAGDYGACHGCELGFIFDSEAWPDPYLALSYTFGLALPLILTLSDHRLDRDMPKQKRSEP